MARGMAQWSRALAALAEDLGLIPGTCAPVPGHPMHSSDPQGHQIHMQNTPMPAGETLTHKMK